MESRITAPSDYHFTDYFDAYPLHNSKNKMKVKKEVRQKIVNKKQHCLIDKATLQRDLAYINNNQMKPDENNLLVINTLQGKRIYKLHDNPGADGTNRLIPVSGPDIQECSGAEIADAFNDFIAPATRSGSFSDSLKKLTPTMKKKALYSLDESLAENTAASAHPLKKTLMNPKPKKEEHKEPESVTTTAPADGTTAPLNTAAPLATTPPADGSTAQATTAPLATTAPADGTTAPLATTATADTATAIERHAATNPIPG